LAFLSKFAAGNELYVKDIGIQIIVACSIYSKETLLESPLILVFIYKNIDILRDISLNILEIFEYFFRPPNLGNIVLPYTLGQGRCDFPYNVKNF
jgi:hypothetical protein